MNNEDLRGWLTYDFIVTSSDSRGIFLRGSGRLAPKIEGIMDSISNVLEQLRELSEQYPVCVLGELFSQAGYELALVGGPVRDVFLGKTVNDFDFTTNAKPDDILRVLGKRADATWDIGRAFGTIGARFGSDIVEITTYRSDQYDESTRKPEVVFGDSIEQDLFRRDFTVNAIALRIPQLQLIDPSGGIEDLLAGRLKTPISPEASFGDDALRMLRAARFSSQLGFDVEEETYRALSQMKHRLDVVSAERIRDEFVKLLCTESPRKGLDILVQTGLADEFFPELSKLRLETDEYHRHKDVYEHSLVVLEQAIGYEKSRNFSSRPDLILRLAALLHDIGKPNTRRFEKGGTVSFHHHDIVGARLATKRLKQLRFDSATIDAVYLLIELHLRFFGYSESQWSDSAVRRYVRDAKGQLERLHILTRSDVTTRNVRKADRLSFAYDDLESRIEALAQQEELNAIRPDLDGKQVMEILQLQPGPDVGLAMNFLLELRLDEGTLEHDEVVEKLVNWWKKQ